jgi:hypothetical protein
VASARRKLWAGRRLEDGGSSAPGRRKPEGCEGRWRTELLGDLDDGFSTQTPIAHTPRAPTPASAVALIPRRSQLAAPGQPTGDGAKSRTLNNCPLGPPVIFCPARPSSASETFCSFAARASPSKTRWTRCLFSSPRTHTRFEHVDRRSRGLGRTPGGSHLAAQTKHGTSLLVCCSRRGLIPHAFAIYHQRVHLLKRTASTEVVHHGQSYPLKHR